MKSRMTVMTCPTGSCTGRTPQMRRYELIKYKIGSDLNPEFQLSLRSSFPKEAHSWCISLTKSPFIGFFNERFYQKLITVTFITLLIG